MKDPIRFLDDTSEASEIERAVLGSSFDAPPSQAIEDQIFARIAASAALAPLAAVALEHGLKSASTLKATIAVGVAKGFVIGVAVYGAALGTQKIAEHFSTHAEAPSVHVAPKPAPRARPNTATKEIIPESGSIAEESSAAPSASAGPRATSTLSAAPAQTTAPTPSGVPAVAAFAEERPAAAARASELEAEARSLRAARAALRTGQLATARTVLEESSARFAAPLLYQEREALMIELLAREGEVSKARQRAHIFLEQFPESPHAARIKQLTSAP